MRAKGLTLKAVLVIVAVVGGAFAILLAVNKLVLESADEAQDTKNMRAIYVALSVYQQANDGLPAPDIYAVHRDLGDPKIYQAANDPFTKGSSFPIDPAFPDSILRSPTRISFTYLPQWAKAGKIQVNDWRTELRDVQVGLLACYWYGDIDMTNTDGHTTNGPVIRINMDGSVTRIQSRKDKQTLTVDDLFLKK